MAVLSVLATKFVTLALEKELAGYYNSAYGYLQIFGILADFGLYAVAVREVNRATDRMRTLGAFFVVRFCILTISLGLAIGIVLSVPHWRESPFALSVIIASLVPFFTLLAGMLRTVFQVEYRLHFVFIAEVVQRIITTALIGAFVLLGYRNSSEVWVEQAFLWIGGGGAFVLLVLSAVYASRLVKLRLCFDKALIRHIVVLAMPFGVAYICMTLYRQLDVVFIAFLRPDFAIQNAYYGIVGRVEDMAFLIPTFLLNSVLPMLVMRRDKGQDVRDLLGKTLLILLLTGSVFTLASCIWAKPLTLLLSRPDYLSTAAYAGADRAFELTGPVMFLNGIVLYCFYAMLATHSWRRLTASLATGAVLSVILNLLLIPKWGFQGAAVAMVVVHIQLSLLLLPQVQRALPARLTRDEILRWLAFSALLAAFLWLLRPYLTTFPVIVAGCAAFSAWIGFSAWICGIFPLLRFSRPDRS